MKCNYKSKQISTKVSRAMQSEIRRQVVELNDAYYRKLDALVLYTLYSEFNFGKTRLRRFFDAFKVQYDKLVEMYQLPEDVDWVAEHKLKEIGVDLESWYD